MESTRRFFKLLELDKKEISYIYLYALFAGFITLSLPLGIQAIINLMVAGEVSSSLFLLIGIITAGIAFNGFLTIMQLTVTETLQRRIFTRSAFEFAWRVPRLKLEALSGIYPPELINRFFDTITLQKGIPKILIDSSTAILQILFGLILLSLYHPFFVFFGLILIIILAGMFWFTGKRGLKSSLIESKYKYQVAHWLEELGRAMSIFKLSGGCDLPIKRTNNLVSNYMDARKSHFRVLLVQYGSVVLFKTTITAALLFLGSVLVIRNQITIGQFVAAEIIVLLIMNSAEKLILGMENIYDVLTALDKIGFVTDLPLESDTGIAFDLIHAEKGVKVELDKVTFQFSDSDKPTLKDVSLKIDAGERVCIAGYNGSGKSTLIQLLEGLYSNFEGMITYNGVPMRTINLESLRKDIGSLNTRDEIFNGSVIENINLGNDSVSLKEIIQISKEIGLHDLINRLPEGYHTELLAGGINVPGSTRTKIMLTRIFISQPDLLVLENFLPRIEQMEKEHLMDFLTDQSKSWTMVAVSNNPNFAAKCDRVIILKNGEVLTEGKFEDLKHNLYVREVFKLKGM
ncbi:MAG: ATP-binding cassette domain-containing protein [Bacteroidetes bacterium]|nr:ATP-binding cassette domain-containing protein [Bacteroidota bacterium]